jgi:hypothetical protein
VCECYSNFTLTYEAFNLKVLDSTNDMIQYLIETGEIVVYYPRIK